MELLIVGLLLFFGIHSVSIFNDPWRNRVVEKTGPILWKTVYSSISLVGIYLIVAGYNSAHHNAPAIYLPPPWLVPLATALQSPVFPLLLAAYIRGRIAEKIKHPMLLATILWAAAHLLVNGQLTDLLLFGTSLVWASVDLYSLNGRKQRPLPGVPLSKLNDLAALILGLVLYAGVILSWHEALSGVALS